MLSRFFIFHSRILAPVFVLLITLLLAWGAASSVCAQETHATVRLDGRALFRVGETNELSARERARQIETRLLAVLENPGAVARAQITNATTGEREMIIAVAGRPLVTVSAVDAEENLTTVKNLATQWSQAIDDALERAGERRLSERGRFLISIQGGIETAFARLFESATVVIPRLLAAALVIALFWLLASAVRWGMKVIFRRAVADLTVENLIRQVGYYAVWLIGLIVAANAFGLEPETAATGLGLTSLALGFALKDVLSNFVCGLLILTLRPFELGDQIVIGDTEGSVERIELRATLIRTYDGRIVSVPNSETFTSRVINNTASPVRRANVSLTMGYDADLRLAIQTVIDATANTKGVLNEPAISVRISQLGPDNIVLEVRFWTDSRRSDFLATESQVRLAIIEACREHNIGLPNPDLRILRMETPMPAPHA